MQRLKLIDSFLGKVEEWVDRSEVTSSTEMMRSRPGTALPKAGVNVASAQSELRIDGR